ncbi:50S ribosome-binding GTPase [candidate division KSB1 bacterium]|nr:50S ribosome-binding GTPase [candidate division KSB1 bacterium]MBL7094904.1 50S ribosome-binding GTPase [candidate division KSB1 bacterium]
MPANLTPQYYAAEERYKAAKENREKMKALKEMMAMIPKHKGTEKLQGDIKKKMARLKDEMDVKKSKGGNRFSFSVEREGAAQVMVVGAPNVGKTLLINSLTSAHLEVADYPFTTRIFHPAMMPYKDIQIQLVDLPAISEQHLENWVSSMIRISDMILLVVNTCCDELLEQMEITLSILEKYKIYAEGKIPNESLEPIHWICLKTIVIANKADLPTCANNLKILEEFYGERFQIIPVSALNKTNLDSIKFSIVEILQLIRVYSKRPGHDAEMAQPFTFQKGNTLLDFAQAVHKDFARNLKFARVWGKDVFDGQRINKDYILQDEDVIELHL